MHDQCTFVDYNNDTATNDQSSCETVYQDVSDFARWCGDHFLDHNEHKTEELVVDFRRGPTSLKDLIINGETVNRVLEYVYDYT